MGTGVIGVHAGRRLWRGARFRMFPGSGPLGVAASTRRGVWTRGLRDGLGQPRPEGCIIRAFAKPNPKLFGSNRFNFFGATDHLKTLHEDSRLLERAGELLGKGCPGFIRGDESGRHVFWFAPWLWRGRRPAVERSCGRPGNYSQRGSTI